MEAIFRDRIEIPVKLVIDVTDEPDGLSEGTKQVLRRLVADDPGERALALEDLAMAFMADSPAACTMTYGSDSAEAVQELAELGALDMEVDGEIGMMAAEARREANRTET